MSQGWSTATKAVATKAAAAKAWAVKHRKQAQLLIEVPITIANHTPTPAAHQPVLTTDGTPCIVRQVRPDEGVPEPVKLEADHQQLMREQFAERRAQRSQETSAGAQASLRPNHRPEPTREQSRKRTPSRG